MNGTEKYLRAGQVCELLGVTRPTLITWENAGKIKSIRTRGGGKDGRGHRRYLLSDLIADLPEEKEFDGRKICYCRVSTRSQKEDLERQVEYFRLKYPNHEIIRDYGSGINFKRAGFNTILDLGISGNLKELVVTHKDRLCRFGYGLVERLLTQYSRTKIVVLNQRETSPEQELIDDVISIITVFSSRLYGLRSHSVKREIEKTIKNAQIQTVSDSGRESKNRDVGESI